MKKSETKTILHARSKETGIVFYSNLYPKIGVEAYKEGKEIYTRIIYTSLDEYIYLSGDGIKTVKKRINLITVIFYVILIFLALKLHNLLYFLLFGYFAVVGLGDLINILYMSYYMKFKNNGDFARYHAAEHKICNAYDKYQRLPTLEEIKKESRFSKYCGSMESSRKIIFSLGYFLSGLIFFSNGMYKEYIISIIVVFFISITLNKYLQIFITSKPNDEDIKLAMDGVEMFLEIERRLQNGDRIYVDGGWDQIYTVGFRFD